MSRRRTITCACCGHTGGHGGHGWLTTCYARWRDAGRPDTGPPPPPTAEQRAAISRANAAKARAALTHNGHSARVARMEDYAELIAWGHTRRQAAERLGISRRTTHRYDRHLDAEQELAA